ncbi:protein of unknown function [Candidatus Nitrospira inopinata]|uniref:Uncharacterized protein n=1 Tax=Candidatus Nitrospira inopinata TaxID=1715989 RepID=A0A0S4KY43_9BACT|nr:protein of unknown function [Candidatus Nitrospira inopinata]
MGKQPRCSVSYSLSSQQREGCDSVDCNGMSFAA